MSSAVRPLRPLLRAYRRLPIRWRLAGGSAVLTFVILASFAVIVGVLTDRQVLAQFHNTVRASTEGLAHQLDGRLRYREGLLNCGQATVRLSDYAAAEHAQIRIFDLTGLLLCTQDDVRIRGAKAPPAVPAFDLPPRPGSYTQFGYLVVVRSLDVKPHRRVLLSYSLPLSAVDRTIARVRVFLLLGVFGGTVLALLAGLATAARAIRPIVRLTEAAGEIARTRDPSRTVPRPEAEDEVAELAGTLQEMLGALDTARGEAAAMLQRQRDFVADASHELRTPLTSVLANLELLADELEGEAAESAQAALRSTQRMRRLVGDLLLLARVDAARRAPQRPLDLGGVLRDVIVELSPMAEGYDLSVDAGPALLDGARDDLHRMALNLIENGIRHTPPGTRLRICTRERPGAVELIVEDDGPGVPPQVEGRLFDRFVRDGRDGARGSGLGLAIVRAVAESHRGTVTFERPRAGGSRFIVCLPAAPAALPVSDAAGT